MILRHHETSKEIAETREVEHEISELCRQQLYDSSYSSILERRLGSMMDVLMMT